MTHVDLLLQEELIKKAEITARQTNVANELTALSKPLFSDASPAAPVPIEELFKRGQREARRELLRQELQDLSAMLDARPHEGES